MTLRGNSAGSQTTIFPSCAEAESGCQRTARGLRPQAPGNLLPDAER